jgi:hypothetical protein
LASGPIATAFNPRAGHADAHQDGNWGFDNQKRIRYISLDFVRLRRGVAQGCRGALEGVEAEMNLLIRAGAEKKILRIAEKNGYEGRREAARVFARLAKIAKTPVAFWNIYGSASGDLHSVCAFKSGTVIWRLCPKHVYCIPLLAREGNDLLVLTICNQANIQRVERHLINFIKCSVRRAA